MKSSPGIALSHEQTSDVFALDVEEIDLTKIARVFVADLNGLAPLVALCLVCKWSSLGSRFGPGIQVRAY